MTAAVWSLLGWVFFSLSLSRHQLDALGRALTPRQERLCRSVGAGLLALSLWPAIRRADIGVALVEWMATLSVAALLVTAVLTWRPRGLPHLVAGAVVLALVLTAAA